MYGGRDAFSDDGCLLSSVIKNMMRAEPSRLGRCCRVDCELWRSVLFLSVRVKCWGGLQG